MVTRTSRRCRLPRLVHILHPPRYGWPRQLANIPRRCYRIGRLRHSTRGNFSHCFARLRLYNLKLSPTKSRIDAARVDFFGHVISQDAVHPNDDKIAALAQMLMPRDNQQLRSLLGGLSYYRKFLPNMAKRVRSITSLLKQGAMFNFTPPMKAAVRALLAELAAPLILVFSDWDAVIAKSRPFRLHCDASTYGLGATLEQEQLDGSIHPTVYTRRATLPNERNWTPMELEAGCVVWSIRRLRRSIFSVSS